MWVGEAKSGEVGWKKVEGGGGLSWAGRERSRRGEWKAGLELAR